MKAWLFSGVLLGSAMLQAAETVSVPVEKVSHFKVSGPTIAWWCYSADGGVGPFSAEETIALARKFKAAIDLAPHNKISEIKKQGVSVSCIGMKVEGKPPFTLSLGNPKENGEIKAAMVQAIDVASIEKVPMVLVFTGNKAPELSLKEQFDKLVVEYKAMANYAKSKGVQLVLECLNDNKFLGKKGGMKGHPGYMGSNPWLCLDLVKAVGMPDTFGLALDWYHLGTEDYTFGVGNAQDLEVFIKAAKPYILHTHVAGVYDNHVLQRGPLHATGQKVDYKRIYQALGMKISYCLENPIYGGAEDKAAAEKTIAEAIKIIGY